MCVTLPTAPTWLLTWYSPINAEPLFSKNDCISSNTKIGYCYMRAYESCGEHSWENGEWDVVFDVDI